MLLPVILVILWLAVILLLVAVCRMAARGDGALAVAADRSTLGGRERSPTDRLNLPALAHGQARQGRALFTVRGVRRRGGRCVAGS